MPIYVQYIASRVIYIIFAYLQCAIKPHEDFRDFQNENKGKMKSDIDLLNVLLLRPTTIYKFKNYLSTHSIVERWSGSNLTIKELSKC